MHSKVAGGGGEMLNKKKVTVKKVEEKKAPEAKAAQPVKKSA